MKVKKFNEKFASEMAEEELDSFRKRKFPEDDIYMYELWGENLDFLNLKYKKLYSSNNLEDCIDFYNDHSKYIDKKYSRGGACDNFFILEQITKSKLTNLDIYLDTKKYNL